MSDRAITILGMGPTAFERKVVMVQFCVGEVWSLNNAYMFYDGYVKFDRYFELHTWDYLKAWNPGHGGDHFKALDGLGCPVFTIQPLPCIVNQQNYNLEKVLEHFKTNYFLGSPSLMLALALYEHDMGDTVSEIRSWGIDTSDPQHEQQRQSWTYWTARAMERGIKLSGTALHYITEYEKDDGLRGVREKIGDRLTQKALTETP